MRTTTELDRIARDGCRLLLGVARLGDRDIRGWWRSSAMDRDVGRFVLGNTFPRTARLAGAELVVLSAARRHRQVLERPNAVHLFSDRLHFYRWTTAWIAEQKTGVVDQLIDELEAWTDADVASAALADWVGVPPPSAETVAGALNLGRIPASDLDDPERVLILARSMAACYVTMSEFSPPYVNVSEG
ncbi:MAG TPA: BrxE family protein [Acidimicrobiales bacterium]|nr:BrxE family protein [Acidimicrobiales bacterium]